MNHAELADDLPFYVNGTLDAERRAAVEAELAVCGRCLAEVRSIETLRDALLAAERDADADAEAPDRHALLHDVRRRIDAASPSVARRRIVPRFVRIGGGIAAAVALALGLAHLERPAGTAPAALSPAALPPAVTSEAAPPRAAAVAPATLGDTYRSRSFAAPASHRELARAGSIALVVPDVAKAIAGIASVAHADSGTIVRLDDRAPVSGSARTAHVTLDVPDGRFEPAMAEVERLGRVTSRAVTSEDLTVAIVDGDARLRNLRREERDLRAIMDRSGRVSDVLDVEQHLASTREEIERLDGESRALRARVRDATIAIDLVDDRATVPASSDAGTQLSTAWHRSVADVRAFTIRQIARLFEILVFSPYLLATIAVAVAILRAFRRRGLRGAAAVRR